MEYYETREFLQKLITLKSNLEDANQNEKGDSERKGGSEKDLPF